MSRQRVDAQPAYVLCRYPYSETSLIVEVFARDFGRMALLARGARRPRSELRGLLLEFQPLELGWSGKGEVKTLMKAEWQGGLPPPAGRALFCAYYLNELLLKLLPREDAHEGLFAVYADTLERFSAGVSEADLRRFEHALLAELGYGLTLTRDVAGEAIDGDAWYAYQIERGPSRLPSHLPGRERGRETIAVRGDPSSGIQAEGQGVSPPAAPVVRGRTLLDLDAERFSDPYSLAEAKQLMRALLNHYLDGRALQTRRIFMELNLL